MKYTFILVQKAKKSGGDKYCNDDLNSEWVIYIPQEISRLDSLEPKNQFEIEIEI